MSHKKITKPVSQGSVNTEQEKKKLNENQPKPQEKGIGSGMYKSWYDH